METLLNQKRFFIQTTTVTLKDSNHIAVEQREGLSFTEQTFRLDDISPNPTKVQSVRLRWAIASLLMFMLTSFVFYASFQKEGLHLGGLTVALMFAFLTIVSIVKSLDEIRSRLIFTEAQTNRPLFSIDTLFQDKSIVDRFVESLKAHIQAVRYSEGLSPQQRYEQYRKHISFLFEEGILTEEYSTILERLEKQSRAGGVIKLVTGDI